jgi:uncharacterized protein
MQLDLEKGSGILIRSFSIGKLHVNDQIIDRHVMLTADEIISDWSPAPLENLSITDFALALERNPEVILFGTGLIQRFPNMQLITEIVRQGIGFEIMDTAAACRTFNVLAAEQRRVVAALLLR